MRAAFVVAIVALSLAGCYSRTVEEKPVVVQSPPANTVIQPAPSNTYVQPAPGTTVIVPAR